jgi:hypothetical protein
MEIKEILGIEKYSKGYKNCEFLIEKMKKLNKSEFSKFEIKNLIAKHIGYSILSQDRYFHSLIVFGFIKKLDNGNYATT